MSRSARVVSRNCLVIRLRILKLTPSSKKLFNFCERLSVGFGQIEANEKRAKQAHTAENGKNHGDAQAFQGERKNLEDNRHQHISDGNGGAAELRLVLDRVKF